MRQLAKTVAARLARLPDLATPVARHERRALALAFACNFVLLASYYILRPVRDTVATVVGTDRLQLLFTGTFVGTLLASPLYAMLLARFRLTRLLPGIFWFWLINILLFQQLFALSAHRVQVAAAYYIWFSVSNLFMISLFWSLMVDIFTAAQATRLFALIAAGGHWRSVADAATGQPPAPGRHAAAGGRRLAGRDRAGLWADA